jgi:predicted RNase H-like nuclease (RuvC/YqgF family)
MVAELVRQKQEQAKQISDIDALIDSLRQELSALKQDTSNLRESLACKDREIEVLELEVYELRETLAAREFTQVVSHFRCSLVQFLMILDHDITGNTVPMVTGCCQKIYARLHFC